EFPYSVRVESLITQSCGSSSMASVCGGCLSLMDAGVPVKSPVAGVAMGLLLDENGGSEDGAIVLTDILGIEDALGTMDFKVAGDIEAGITTFQLDIKCEGLTTNLLRRALNQAREGRLHILGEMYKAMPGGPREVSPLVPRAKMFQISPDKVGRLIGPGGKNIRQTMMTFSLESLDVDDDGAVTLTAFNATNVETAVTYIGALMKDEERRKPAPDTNLKELVGNIYRGCPVKNTHNFGVFVEILPGVEGLVHISEMDLKRVVSVTAQFSP
ncbi:unnamed protein product, partial [Discosporangium mesarthrocarpum]